MKWFFLTNFWGQTTGGMKQDTKCYILVFVFQQLRHISNKSSLQKCLSFFSLPWQSRPKPGWLPVADPRERPPPAPSLRWWSRRRMSQCTWRFVPFPRTCRWYRILSHRIWRWESVPLALPQPYLEPREDKIALKLMEIQSDKKNWQVYELSNSFRNI